MANSNYSQVVDLLAAGRLNWNSDLIKGYLCSGAVFDASNKLVDDVAGDIISTAVIQGRVTAPGGQLLGYPAFFAGVAGQQDYEMLLVQETGVGSPNLLAFFDSTGDDELLHMENDGTLVLRPGPPDPPIDGAGELTRLWMKV